MTSQDNVEDLENSLRRAATDGKWPKVLQMYEANRQLRTAKITAKGDTVLHVAVSSGKDRVVETMVYLVCEERINVEDYNSPLLLPSRDENDYHIKLVLGAEDYEGNTPLHLAASMGNVEMCKKISGVDSSLTAKRNNAGETPLFMAALHGKREPFLWIYYRYTGLQGDSSTGIPHCIKRDNNDTILHCALEGGYIDVAIEIVLLCKNHLKEMVSMRNKNQLSPIHFLAATPSAFQSTHVPTLPLAVQLLYYCCTFLLRVKKKKQATTEEELIKRERRRCRCPRLLALFDAIKGCVHPRLLALFDAIKECVPNLIERFLDDPSLSELIRGLLSLASSFIRPLVAGYGFRSLRRLREEHVWSLQIMEELLQHPSDEDMSKISVEKDSEAGSIIVDTPLMIAAQNGITEMVEKILENFKSAMNAVNEEGKNTVLLAAEKRQTKVYQILCENKNVDKSAFRKVDEDGNTALHFAAKLEVNLNKRTTTVVEEYKWFEFVKNSLHFTLWEKCNNGGKTAEDIFRDSHEHQMSRDREWLNQTSIACSVVSTLVASPAYTNVAVNCDKKDKFSLAALSFSLTSTISFLAILASHSQSLKFWRYAPVALYIAIFAMFGSIVSLWISHVLRHHCSLKIYAILGSPIAIVTVISVPILIGPTLMFMFTKVPSPSNKTTSAIRYQRPQKMETLQKNIGSRTELPTGITEGSKKWEIEEV